MILHNLQIKIKSFSNSIHPREFYTAALIVLVGFASFGLGRISSLEEGRTPIRIEQGASAISSVLPSILSKPTRLDFVHAKSGGEGTGGVVSSPVKDEGFPPEDGSASTLAETIKDSPAIGGKLVASKAGTKYHFPWCAGAQQISEKNKIWFNSAEEAQRAGYSPAANCKGLK